MYFPRPRMGVCENFQRVIADHDAHRRAAHRLANIAADPVMACAFDRANQLGTVASLDRVDQHLAHPARGTRHHKSRHIRHLLSPNRIAPSLACRSPLGKVCLTA